MGLENLLHEEISKLKFLSVEDNLMIQEITKIIFKSENMSLDLAHDGKNALDIFSPGKYDLIYLDIGLPDISGCDLSNKIYKLEKSEKIGKLTPVIALTAHSYKIFDGKECHFDGWLNKPLTAEKNKKIIDRFVFNHYTDIEGLHVFDKL